jgi:hypothetical protein
MIIIKVIPRDQMIRVTTDFVMTPMPHEQIPQITFPKHVAQAVCSMRVSSDLTISGLGSKGLLPFPASGLLIHDDPIKDVRLVILVNAQGILTRFRLALSDCRFVSLTARVRASQLPASTTKFSATDNAGRPFAFICISYHLYSRVS